MQVTVFGSGYVGLVLAACLAEIGHQVKCVDVDQAKIDLLNSGGVPIYEPGLAELIETSRKANKIMFTTDPALGLEQSEIAFIAVGTPQDEDGSADLHYVLEVAKTIGEHIHDYTIIVDKSTVPVGTGDQVRAVISKALALRSASVEFDVVSNPEFLKEGAAIQDFRQPDRIIVGTDSPRAEAKMRELYATYTRNTKNPDCLMVMDIRSAELSKYAANAMLATKISFMNQLANLATRVDADIEQVRVGIGSDPRIGYHFIYPGCGYGGSCFGKDVKALMRTANAHGCELPILEAVEQVNDRQKQIIVEKLNFHFDNQLKGLTIALWGLSFKPGTDDMRDAPSRVVVEQLQQAGARIQAYDPESMEEARRIYKDNKALHYSDSPEDALEGADALVILTEWRVFRNPDFNKMKAALRNPVVVDGRNIFNPDQMSKLGFSYYGIGRGLSSYRSLREDPELTRTKVPKEA